MLHPFFAVPVIAIILATAMFQRWRLLGLTAVLCVFPVAAIVDFRVGDSAFSLTPPLMCAALLPLSIVVYERRGSARRIARETTRVYAPLFCFTAFALLSSYLVPTLLAGKYEVAPAMDRSAVVPLEWGRTNITQSLYLLLLVVFAASVTGALVRRPRAIRRVLDAYIWSGYLAALLGVYQFVSNRWGWYYPYDVLYSRPEVRSLSAFVREYHIGGVSLMQVYGSFSEPSTLAQFMLGAAMGCLYWWLRGNAPAKVKGLAVASLAVLAMTLSTTAYAGLPAGVLLVLSRFVVKGKLRVAIIVSTVVLGGAGITAGIFAGSAGDAIRPTVTAILDFVLMQKAQTESYSIRLTVDGIAVRGLIDTGGLGLGWGSTRGSSLLIHLLGNAGVIGAALLCWFMFRLRSQIRRARSTPGLTFAGMALFGNLLGGIIAVPDIVSVTIWLLLGILVAITLTPPDLRLALCSTVRLPESRAIGRPELSSPNLIH